MKFKNIILINTLALFIVGLVACSNPLPANAKNYSLTNSWGQKGDKPGEFNEPTGIAINGDEVFISDARNKRIQVFDLSGKFKREFGNTGNKTEKLGRPMNIAIQGSEIYVADYFNDQIKIYSLAGQYKKSIGSSGSKQGQFNAPVGVDVAKNGDIYVADFYNQRVQQFNAEGKFIRQWGETKKVGVWSGKFNYPTDVALDNEQNLYVADGYNDRVQVFDAKGNYSHKWGGLFGMNVSGKRPGWFTTVTSIKVGFDGLIYVADFNNDRIQIFNRNGEFLNLINVASNNIQHSSIAMAVATDGSVYIVNHGKHEIQRWENKK